jgi:hypothetical protein
MKARTNQIMFAGTVCSEEQVIRATQQEVKTRRVEVRRRAGRVKMWEQ